VRFRAASLAALPLTIRRIKKGMGMGMGSKKRLSKGGDGGLYLTVTNLPTAFQLASLSWSHNADVDPLFTLN
jgi:hypothetical protein